MTNYKAMMPYLIKQGGRVNGDFFPHIPVRVLQSISKFYLLQSIRSVKIGFFSLLLGLLVERFNTVEKYWNKFLHLVIQPIVVSSDSRSVNDPYSKQLCYVCYFCYPVIVRKYISQVFKNSQSRLLLLNKDKQQFCS